MVSHDEDDEKEALREERNASSSRNKDFDCPNCNANNPVDPPFANGAELLCHYCGTEYRASLSDGGRVKLKEI